MLASIFQIIINASIYLDTRGIYASIYSEVKMGRKPIAEPAQHTLAVRVTAGQLAKLQSHAELTQQTVTEVHRAILEEFIDGLDAPGSNMSHDPTRGTLSA